MQSGFSSPSALVLIGTLLQMTLLSVPDASAAPPPILTTPTISNLAAGSVTLGLRSDDDGIGYFTILPGSSAACGSGAQIKAGLNSTGAPAFRVGSLTLMANIPGYYTVRNLTASIPYTVCFTAENEQNVLQPTPVSANLTTTAAATHVAPAWTPVGSAGFTAGQATSTSLAFAPDGTPHVAYVDFANTYKATVMKYSGGVWSVVGSGGFSAGSAEYPSLAFAPDGKPHVAYRDAANSLKATVMKYSSGVWSVVGSAGFSAGQADYTSLVFAPDGTPHVAYRDAANGSKATVMKYSGGVWSVVGSAGFSAAAALYTSLAFAPDGTPHVAYRDAANGLKATVMKYSGGVWSVVGSAGFSAGEAAYTSLAFAPDGTPQVAFKDNYNTGRATVMKYSGGVWNAVGGAGFSADVAAYTSLAFAPDGTPHVAYMDYANSYKATVMKYSGGVWSVVGSAGFSAGEVAYTSLAFAPDGTPHVAYEDNGNSYKATVMKFTDVATINALSRQTPAALLTNAAGVTFRATFSSTVSGVAAGHFDLSPTVAGAAITGVAPVGPAPANQWDIMVTTGSGSGPLTLRLVTSYGISSAILSALPYSGESYTIDKTAPTVTIGSPMMSTVLPDAVDYLITYADQYFNVSTLTPGNVTLNTSGTAGGTVSVSGSGTSRTVTISSISGSGTIGISLAAGTATDQVGHTAPAAGPSGTFEVPASFTLSTPSITNIGAGSATLVLQSSDIGIGYFTLIPGSSAACGSGNQIKAGQDSTGAPAFRVGSMVLTANIPGYYTVRNLTASTPYTVCFTVDNGTISLPISANLATTAAATHAAPAWNPIGSAGFSAGNASYTSLAFAPDGTLYVAYQDGAISNMATVMKFNGSSWVLVGSAGFSAGSTSDLSLVFAPDGLPYLGYKDGASKAALMKFNGSSWVAVGSAGFSAGIASYTSLAFAPDGTPYMAYKDEHNGSKATVMKFNGTSWVPVGSAGFSAGGTDYSSLAFAPDGVPYLAYRDFANSSKATAMKFNGSSWVAVGSAGFSAGIPSYTSLAFAPDGTPYLAYMDDANSSRATVMKFNGSSWVLVGSAGFSAGAAYYTSLAFAPDGTPHVAYRDAANGSKATMMKYSGGVWSVVGSAGFTAGQADYTSLAFAPDGTPYVAYEDYANSYKTTVMKLVETTPSVTTGPADAISATGATVNGTVNDNGSATTVTFDYGLTTGYGSSVSGGTVTAGSGMTPVSAPIGGLICGTTYHFRVTATNSVATVSGSDQTFTTSACLPQTIAFGAAPTLMGGGTGTASATGGASGNPVTFSSQTPTVCTTSGANGATVTGVSAGTCTIAANQAGGGAYAAAPQATQSFAIDPSAAILTVTVTKTGSAFGTVTSDPVGISCTGSGAGCSQPFAFVPQVVRLFATPSATSVFSGWDGACSGTVSPCVLNVTADAAVTATFDPLPLVKTGGGNFFASIMEAYLAIGTGSGTLQLQSHEFNETFTFNQPITLILKGGYNSGFTAISGITTIRGPVTIIDGTIIPEDISIGQ